MASKISHLVALLCLCCAVASASPTQRVVGGDDADMGQFPFQVVLFKDNQFTCGGSIISSRHVLTAAHCVVIGSGTQPLPARYFTVRVGSIQRQAGGKLINVIQVNVNQEYGNFLNDVAVLKLAEELQFTDKIQKIDMFSGEVPSGESVVVSGWGRLYHGGPVSDRLQYNTLKALDSHECDEAINWGYDEIICLAHPKDNGVCNGDSGGPATYQGKLVGVAGFVVGGCGNIYPDGYAKVSFHRNWILDNMD